MKFESSSFKKSIVANKFNKIIIISLAFFLVFVLEAHGQTRTPSMTDVSESVDIKTLPELPSANQDASVRIESYSFDLNSSEIIWALNGVIKDKGIGKKDFDFKTGAIGTVSLIKILIKTKDGKNIEKSLVIRPAGVDIVWQADSFVPPFYRGKALYSYQSRITVVALPEFTNSAGVKINPEKLIYKWSKDGSVLGGISGYGKNKFSFTKLSISSPPEIEVEVSSDDKKIRASGSITIEPGEPKTVLYENNPLYGIIYEKAVANNFKMNESEITLAVAPYFFGLEELNSGKVKYNWSMNGQNLNDKQDSKGITFRNADGGSGSTRVSVDLQNEVKELQSARTDVLLNFEADSGGDKTVNF